MSEAIKELLKKDIVFIASLSQQIDYTNKEKIKQQYEELLVENPFHTNFGNRYLKRLKAMIQEEEFEYSCVLCGRDSGENPIICHECAEEIPEKDKPVEVELPTVEEQMDQEQMDQEPVMELDELLGMEVPAEEEEPIEVGLPMVEEPMGQEPVMELDELLGMEVPVEEEEPIEVELPTAEAPMDQEPVVELDELLGMEVLAEEEEPIEVELPTTEVSPTKSKEQTPAFYKRRIYLLCAIVVMLLLLVWKQSIIKEQDGVSKKQYSSVEAQKLVEEFYNSQVYKILLHEVGECPKAIFEAAKGKQVPQDAWIASEMTGVYAFSVKKGSKAPAGQVWVSFQGEVIQLGMSDNEKFMTLKETKQ